MPESNRNEVKYTNCTNIEYSVANGAEYLEFNGVRDGSIESMRWTINLHWTESIGIEEGDPPKEITIVYHEGMEPEEGQPLT